MIDSLKYRLELLETLENNDILKQLVIDFPSSDDDALLLVITQFMFDLVQSKFDFEDEDQIKTMSDESIHNLYKE